MTEYNFFRCSTVVNLSRSKPVFVGTLVVFILISQLIFFIATKNGIGVLPDSVSYFAAAKSLLTTGQLVNYDGTIMTHWPPMYPAALFIFNFFGDDIVESSKWFHSILYSFNLFLFCLVIFWSTKKKFVYSITGAVFFLSSSSILHLHVYALSEPVFLFFTLVTMLLTGMYFKNNNRIYLLFVSLFLGLSIITRYIGFALIPPVVICILLTPTVSIIKRVKYALMVIALSLVPIGIWMVRNLRFTGSAVNRSLHYNPIGLDKIYNYIST